MSILCSAAGPPVDVAIAIDWIRNQFEKIAIDLRCIYTYTYTYIMAAVNGVAMTSIYVHVHVP